MLRVETGGPPSDMFLPSFSANLRLTNSSLDIHDIFLVYFKQPSKELYETKIYLSIENIMTLCYHSD